VVGSLGRAAVCSDELTREIDVAGQLNGEDILERLTWFDLPHELHQSLCLLTEVLNVLLRRAQHSGASLSSEDRLGCGGRYPKALWGQVSPRSKLIVRAASTRPS